MASFTYELDEDTILKVDRETIEVSTALPQASKAWKATDSQGHEHAYADGPDRYPTLETRFGEPYWCDDCRDEHQDSWLVCRICGEAVEPGTFVDTSPQFLPGRVSYTLNGKPITKDRAEEILTRTRREHDDATRITSRPAIGSRVRLDDDTVTVLPTPEAAAADSVTVMFDGTGRMETVPLERLRSR